MDPKRLEWTVFGARERPSRPLRRRRLVYLRLGDAWVGVRTFAAEATEAFSGSVQTISGRLPAGADLAPGDWVRFEPRHVFSACISHE